MTQAEDDLKRDVRQLSLLVVIAGQAILLGLLIPPSPLAWLGHLTPQTITAADLFVLGLLLTFSVSTAVGLGWVACTITRDVRAWHRGRRRSRPAP